MEYTQVDERGHGDVGEVAVSPRGDGVEDVAAVELAGWDEV